MHKLARSLFICVLDIIQMLIINQFPQDANDRRYGAVSKLIAERNMVCPEVTEFIMPFSTTSTLLVFFLLGHVTMKLARLSPHGLQFYEEKQVKDSCLKQKVTFQP